MMYDSNEDSCWYLEKENWNPFIMEKVGEADVYEEVESISYDGPSLEDMK